MKIFKFFFYKIKLLIKNFLGFYRPPLRVSVHSMQSESVPEWSRMRQIEYTTVLLRVSDGIFGTKLRNEHQRLHWEFVQKQRKMCRRSEQLHLRMSPEL